jgi:NRAMP (natural resistance-associated macrophage protein)-like metal ion transporter
MADDTSTGTPLEGQVYPEVVQVMVDEDEIPPVGDLENFGAGEEEKKEMEEEEDEEVTSLASSQASSRNTCETLQELCTYVGPGFLISVAYMDPGNWATNISGGAMYGTALLWVIVLASLMAIGIQIVAAKLGIATGKDVAHLCRETLSKPVVYILWAAAELAMIATDMAEIIGAAIGFQLVCNFPLWAGAILAVVSSFALIGIRSAYTKGYRYIEFTIMAFVGIIAIVFVIELFLAKPSAKLIFSGLKPTIPDTDALYIAIRTRYIGCIYDSKWSTPS